MGKENIDKEASREGVLIVETGTLSEIKDKPSGTIRHPVKAVKGVFNINRALEEMGKSVIGVPGLTDRVRGVPHEFDFDLYEALYKSESLVFRAINITAYHAMQPGFFIEGGTEKNRELIEDWIEYMGLNVLLTEAVKSLLIWGNIFFEPVMDEDNEFKMIDLKLVPPSTMYVYRTETGDIIGYIQIPKSRRFLAGKGGYLTRGVRLQLPRVKQKSDLQTEKKRGWKGLVRDTYPQAVPFDEDEIIHVKNNATPGSEYGLSVIEPMMTPLTIYQGMRIDIGVITRRYSAPKILWLVGDEANPARNEMMDDFKYYMDTSNIGDDIVIPSYISFEVLGAGQLTMDMEPYLSLLRDDVFAGLSVPEVLMSGSAKGNLASAQIQLESFGRRIVMIQYIIADVMRKKMFPFVLGMDEPLSRSDWKNVPKPVFRPIETEEQRQLRSKNLFDSNIISREEARNLLGMTKEPIGHMALDDQLKLAKEQTAMKVAAGVSPTGGGARGPSQTTGGGGDDKTKAQKPSGTTPKKQGAGVGQV